MGLVLKYPQGEIIAQFICWDLKETNIKRSTVLNIGMMTGGDLKLISYKSIVIPY